MVSLDGNLIDISGTMSGGGNRVCDFFKYSFSPERTPARQNDQNNNGFPMAFRVFWVNLVFLGSAAGEAECATSSVQRQ